MTNEELKNAISEFSSIDTNNEEELVGMNAVPSDEYVPGSAAPQLEPEQRPEPEKEEEPEQRKKPAPKPKIHRPTYAFSSLLTIIGIVVISLCAFFLLSREVAIQERKNEITTLQSDINKLYIERDYLFTQYMSGIDLVNIRELAKGYGMHAPNDDQVIELD